MKVFLVDLFHDNPDMQNVDCTPRTVPLGIGYLGAALVDQWANIDVQLFRSVDVFLEELKQTTPNLLGFSMNSWNMDLTDRAMTLAKKYDPSIPIVVGGPCVDNTEEEIIYFFERYSQVDFVVPSEGEKGIVELVKVIESGNQISEPIDGVAYLFSDSNDPKRSNKRIPFDVPPRLIWGTYEKPDIKNISSPYLTGLLDPFLEQGAVPILQSMRGCPYQCAFCVSGSMDWNKVRPYPLERVYEEIEYIMYHSPTKDLIFTDENWGVLRDRDLELAEFVMKLHREKGYPQRLYYYTAKVITETVHKVAKLVAPIAWIGEFGMSYQTLNPEARKTIKRTNTRLDKLEIHTAWAKENAIETVSELIYGFPHETPESIMDGVEVLMGKGIDRIVLYPLQLFPGIDLYQKRSREMFGLKTRFRAAEGALGVYQDGDLISVEMEEVVVGTNWSTFDDFLKFRRYSFFLMMVLGRAYFYELIQLGNLAGFQMTKLVRHLGTLDWHCHPHMDDILSKFSRDAESELHESKEAVYEDVKSKLQNGSKLGGLKLNLVYLGRVMADEDAVIEILQEIKSFISFESKANNIEANAVLTYIRDVLPHRILPIAQAIEPRITFSSQFNYNQWLDKSFDNVQQLVLEKAIMLEGNVDFSTLEVIRQVNVNDDATLQSYYDKLPNEKIVRLIN
ncbi:MAG: cobalamin-dependent protein [Pseudomonadales bacterium]|nr:cobalamin-dependent protein [Pseudomonadales bacterium]